MKAQEFSAPISVAGLFLLLAIAAHQGAVKAEPADSYFINGADNPFHATSYQTVVSCPFNSLGGDDKLSRGFYVQSYPGTNLGTVQMTYWTSVAGSYTISMTARDETYDGPIIGTTQMVTVDLPASTYVTATFDFGGAPVISGTTVTFSQAEGSGPGSAYYNTGPCGFDLNCTTCSGVYQTSGTTPPLDTVRRRSVAVTIAQVEPHSLYLPLVVK
jgi:hypothetical protein